MTAMFAFATGSTMFNMILNSDAPSRRPDSISEDGTPRNAVFMMIRFHVVIADGMISAKGLLSISSELTSI